MPSPNAERSSKPRSTPNRRAAKRTAITRPAVLSEEEGGVRLQKFLANAGVDSRRNCESFIRDGRVTVDGEVVKNPAVSVQPEEQDVRLDGERLKMPRFRYYLINKPKGVVCTNRDPAGRPRAVDIVPNSHERLFTVGRLDENTQGLLLVTNDGALAEHLAHPRYEVSRQYKVQVAGLPDHPTLTELKKGMHFSDGFFRFQSIRILKRKGRSTFLHLELREGKNREIRRLLAKAGHKVMQLERISFGPLKIGRLDVGECRELRAQEVRDLYQFVESPPQERNADSNKPRKRTPKQTGTSGKRSGSKSSERGQRSQTTSKRGAARNGIAKVKKKPKSKPIGRQKKRRSP